jgi:alcohol dehydrogenase class IV
VKAEMVPEIVAKALEDTCHLTNPRPCTSDDFAALLKAAW